MSVANILTVDVEDWFHICGVAAYLPRGIWTRLESRVAANTRRILRLLAARHIQATFFVLGWVAREHPGLLNEIRSEGHEIAVHGDDHRRVYTLSPAGFEQDLRRAVGRIAAITGDRPLGFRAPEWSIRGDSLWALDILVRNGFRYDSSMAPLPFIGDPKLPQTPHRIRLNHRGLWEFPPLVAPLQPANLPVGGGWGLRCFPYAVTRAAIRRLNSQGHPAVVFLHPTEFDPAPPQVHLPPVKRFVLRSGIVPTETRLHQLLADFRFTTMENAVKRLEGRE